MTQLNMFMPEKVQLGQHMASTVGAAIHNWKNNDNTNPHHYRKVMGYFLPRWQRPFVWTQEQKIKLIESLWLGLNIGTYTFNRTEYEGPYDNLLIDGQQRMWALQSYLSNEFPVFGYRWSQITLAERRSFANSRHFHCYITSSENEQYLRKYYNMMNFGGTAHTEEQRA